MDIDVKKAEKSCVRITITFSKEEVQKAESEVLVVLGKDVDAEGFRKGNAPVDVVREQVGEEKIREEVAHKLLPNAMKKVSEEQNLQPIIRPRVELASEDPFTMVVTIVQQPEIKVKGAEKLTVKKRNIAEVVEEIKKSSSDPAKKDAESKEEKTEEQKKEEERQWNAYAERQENERRERELFDLIAEKVSVDLADELIEDETHAMIEEHVERLKQANLEMESWLKQTGKTAEDFIKEVRSAAEKRLKIRFGVQYLVKKWEISIEDEEMEKAVELFISQVPEEYRKEVAPLYAKGAQNYEQLRSSKIVEKMVKKMLKD